MPLHPPERDVQDTYLGYAQAWIGQQFTPRPRRSHYF